MVKLSYIQLQKLLKKTLSSLKNYMNMEKQRLTKVALWATALAPFLLTACVEDDYDLSKDIDMTITIGGNLNIPGSGTEEFTLADIMDLEENSIIQADENGDYALDKSDTTETDVDVEAVYIKDVAANPSTTPLNFYNPGLGSDQLEAEIKNVTMNFTFTKTDVTTDIQRISSADVDFIGYMTMRFIDNSSNVNAITLKQGLTVAIRMEGPDASDNIDFELLDTENYGFADGDRQTIVFLKDQEIQNGKYLSIPVRFRRIHNFPEGQGLTSPGHFSLKTNVIANGWATTTNPGTGSIEVDLVNNTELEPFYLMAVTGVIDPKIDVNVDPITVNDVPDFLKDEETELDIENPYIRLKMVNPTPVTVNLKAHISWTNGSETAEGFDIGTERTVNTPGQSIVIPGNRTLEYYLSRVRMDNIPQQRNIILGQNMFDMTSKIPDEVRLTDVNAEAIQEETTITLGEEGAHYEVETIYGLNAPLKFGNRLNIVYKDTINDWASDLEDLSIRTAVVSMTALNGIPLDFEIEAKAIDLDGNVYPDVNVDPVNGTIRAGRKIKGDASTQATESNVELRISCKEGSMSNWDGLIITFRGNNKDVTPDMNATLNESMSLQLNNIRIRIENGVTVDLN